MFPHRSKYVHIRNFHYFLVCICDLGVSAKGTGMAGFVQVQCAVILVENEGGQYSAGFKHVRQYMNSLHCKKHGLLQWGF